ncbi:FFLEELY motif protein [Noviherbaspirillum sp. ST9]|uniref:FFLEELY motif protein n=1 Tax=Noviherbaspirillum sp. ST9 TaxID=3401606 RepID=UPI003B586E45
MRYQRDQSGNAGKREAASVIRRELGEVIAARKSAGSDPVLHAARVAVRSFQAQRMADTHADLLHAPGTKAAAQFFLADLYGSDDLTQRDASLERVVPAMERMLPATALWAVAEAVSLDALSEKLDAAMAMRLGANFTEADYIAAYRQSGTRKDRERQIRHVESVGRALCELVRIPLIGSTLAMMRGPAKVANLAELQSFLERGFKAFKEMKDPAAFVATVVHREQGIMKRLYAGEPQPFAGI